MNTIVLTTINAKWIHPSLALRLLKANLGTLEDSCEIIEFALRQPLNEKTEPLLTKSSFILGISVSIWNHTATTELLEALEKEWVVSGTKPVVVLGGPEVSYLPEDAKIFKFADYVIRGEGENAFRTLCEKLTASQEVRSTQNKETGVSIETHGSLETQYIDAQPVNLNQIKSAYHLYTDEDISKKLIYVEASRGCPFACDFCLSAAFLPNRVDNEYKKVREFPLEVFLSEMDELVKRGVKTFKFLDRTFNANNERALRIINFFLEKIEERQDKELPFVVHFEIVALLFRDTSIYERQQKLQDLNESDLMKAFARFPPGSLRLEIGIQTLNKETAARIHRPSNPQKELEVLQFLYEKTNAIIHTDLIAGLPGEDLASFGEGFDRLWLSTNNKESNEQVQHGQRLEIQLGILKLLPGAPISRYNKEWRMRYNPLPPYEIEESSSMTADELWRIKNFARFWEIIVNRGLVNFPKNKPIFINFLALSDSLFSHFGRNWGIDKNELLKVINYMD